MIRVGDLALDLHITERHLHVLGLEREQLESRLREIRGLQKELRGRSAQLKRDIKDANNRANGKPLRGSSIGRIQSR